MTDTTAPHGPFVMSMKVFLQDDDETIAHAAYDFPPGVIPTQEEVVAAVLVARKAVKDMTQGGAFDLMNRHDFVATLMFEQTGMDFAVPGPENFALDYSDPVA